MTPELTENVTPGLSTSVIPDGSVVLLERAYEPVDKTIVWPLTTSDNAAWSVGYVDGTYTVFALRKTVYPKVAFAGVVGYQPMKL